MSRSNVIAVIPAYNEGKTVGAVVHALKSLVGEVIVVNDCSKDDTVSVAEAAGAVVITNEENSGYDETLNNGFREAAKRGADIIVTLDADGEHDANDVPRMVAPILSGTADVVLSQRPGSRHWGERVFMWYTKHRFSISDPLSGMKAYRRSVYDAVGFFDSVHSIGTELSIRAIKQGFRTELVSITLHERPSGDTSRFYISNLKGNLKILRALWRVLFI